MTDTRKILLVKGIGGMANRMLALATGWTYAQLAGRELVVDWSDARYSRRGDNAYPHFFARPGSGLLDRAMASRSVTPSVWKCNLNVNAGLFLKQNTRTSVRDPAEWARLAVDLSQVDHPEETAVYWSHFDRLDELRRHFTGPFAGWRQPGHDALLGRILREDFQLRLELKGRIRRFEKERFRDRMIGVHVRATDLRTRAEAVLQRADALRRRHPEAGIFLATDNRSVEERFRRAFAGVVTTEKWFPPPGEMMHGGTAPDPLENGVEALVDLFLLARCAILVIDQNSSYGYAARLIGGHKRGSVHDMRRFAFVPRRLRRAVWLLGRWVEQRLGFRDEDWQKSLFR